jgi:hypothetical protein
MLCIYIWKGRMNWNGRLLLLKYSFHPLSLLNIVFVFEVTRPAALLVSQQEYPTRVGREELIGTVGYYY